MFFQSEIKCSLDKTKVVDGATEEEGQEEAAENIAKKAQRERLYKKGN